MILFKGAPSIGIFADGANVIISLLRGNLGDAGFSAFAMLPLAGQFATGGKYAKKALKYSDVVADLAKWTKKAKRIKGAPKKVGGQITGYTRHGLNQAIAGNGGRGVNAKAILDAVRNPKKIVIQANGTIKYVGKRANVIFNNKGKVVTTFGKSRGPLIWKEERRKVMGSGSAQKKANKLGFSYWPGAIR